MPMHRANLQVLANMGVTLPELPVVERRIRNQRARVSELCPG